MTNQLKQIASIVGLAVAITTSQGCTMFSSACKHIGQHDGLSKFMLDHRNKSMAAKSWHCQKHRFCNPSKAFKEGFIEGYMDVANGGNGCIPSVAPSKYWGWMYQSSSGQKAVNDWFAGYPQGVRSAEQDGVANWSQVRTYRSPSPPQQSIPPAAIAAPGVLAPAILSDGAAASSSPFVDIDEDGDDDTDEMENDDEDAGDLDMDSEDDLELTDESTVMHIGDSPGAFTFSTDSQSIPELEPRHQHGQANGRVSHTVDHQSTTSSSEVTPVDIEVDELPFSFE